MSRDTVEILRDALGHFDRVQAYARRDLFDELSRVRLNGAALRTGPGALR